MRLAFVVQRYGREIRGGAELHCRLIAERLVKRHEIEVVTTCSRDYLTWSNVYPPGISDVNRLAVWRFPVRRPRDPVRFGRLQDKVFYRKHTEAQALAWLTEQGPYSPALRSWVVAHRDRYDYWICFSYRYWTTFQAMRAAGGRAILVPTAEPDPAIDLPLFHSQFRAARAIVYNSHEERAMILDRSGAQEVPGDVVGVGIQEPAGAEAGRFRSRTDYHDPFILYVGRIDENKGCRQLFEFFIRACERLRHQRVKPPHLVLIGHALLPIPDHPLIHHLGSVDEQEKYDALAAATMLIMPSFYESLSMVLLEAWAMRRPVLVNGHCEVLRGQVVRSRGGLFYQDAEEFSEALRLFLIDDRLRQSCGASGRRYYEQNYRWPVIEEKYESLLTRLADHDGIAPAGNSAKQESTDAHLERKMASAAEPS